MLCALFSLTHARASLEQLVQLEQFDLNATAQQFHTLGNHCISRLSRTFVCEKLAIPTTTSTRPPSASLFTRLMRGCSSTPSTTDLPPTAYYSHDLSPRWVLIVLDTTELSGHANHPPDSEPARESAAYLAANPLSEKNPHMIPWNGGITKRQMAWLKAEIRRAERRGKLVLVACHHPIHPDSARKSHLAWNYREILKVLRKSSNVRLVLSGHDHLGGGCRVTARRGKTRAGVRHRACDLRGRRARERVPRRGRRRARAADWRGKGKQDGSGSGRGGVFHRMGWSQE